MAVELPLEAVVEVEVGVHGVSVAEERALDEEDRVTDAIYEAGYSGPGRFYAETSKRLGMTPSAWRKGGAGVTIRWAIAETSLGDMLVAATEHCCVIFQTLQ